MKYILPFVLLGLLSGCASDLRPDSFPAAQLSNYPSAEFYACGKRFLGLGYCELKSGQNISDLGFAVQGLYKGRIRVFSEALPTDVVFAYEGSKKIPVDLRGYPKRPIVLGIAISPSFPAENENAVEIFGAYAFLLINIVEEGETYEFHKTLRPVGIEQSIEVPTLGASLLGVFSDECGVDEEIQITESSYKLKLSSLIDIEDQGSCIFYMGTDRGKLSTWMSWRYASDFRPLGTPTVKFIDDELLVEAESSVTLITTPKEYVIDHKAEFDLDPNQPTVLRLFTVKGRTLVGEYEPSRGWKWMK